MAGLLNAVPAACAFVAEAAAQAGLDEHAVYHCELAVDEACTNIIEHGYRLRGENQSIDIVCRDETARFSILIMDDAPAFNPLTLPPPDPGMTLDQRGSGGWGIHFIRKFMNEVTYIREGERNCLTLSKFKPSP